MRNTQTEYHHHYYYTVALDLSDYTTLFFWGKKGTDYKVRTIIATDFKC